MSLGSPLGLRRRTIGMTGPLVSDTFDRPNNATSLGTADTGQTWTSLSGTWGIDTNRAYTSGGTSSDRQVAVESGASDVTVAVDVTALDNPGPGLLFRAVDTNNYWVFIAQTAQGDWRLFKRVAGTYTMVGSLVEAPFAGRWEVVCSGSTITCKVDGVTKITTTDSTHQFATLHGLRTFNVAGEPVDRWDNFQVEAL